MNLSNSDKVKWVINQELIKFGWFPVGKVLSGVWEKNGCLFVSQNKNQDICMTKQFTDSGEMRIANALVLLNPRGASWHLEKNGWLLESGTLSGEIVNAYEFGLGSHGQKAMESIIGKIEHLAGLPETALNSYKRAEVQVYSTENRIGFVTCNLNVEQIEYFMVDLEEFPKLSDEYKEKVIYRVEKIEDNTVYIYEMGEDLADGATKLAALEPIDRYTSLFQIKAFIPGRLQVIPVQKQTIEWKPVLTSKSSELPEGFSVFGLDTEQLTYTSIAFTEFLNFTLLLFQQKDVSSKLILELSRKCTDIRPLIGKIFDKDQLNILIKIANQGFPLDVIACEDYHANYMWQCYEELLVFLDRITSELRSEGFSEKSIQFIRTVAFRREGFSHVRINEMCASLHLRDCIQRGEGGPLPSFLLEKGVATEDQVYSAWSLIPPEVKGFYRRRLQAQDLCIKGIVWNEFIEDSLSSATSAMFVAGFGFLLRVDSFFIGYDCNSFAIYSSSLLPIWRAVKINETFLVNRSNEDAICI